MAKIQLRRDTTANWETVDPILAEGEQGLELDTGLLKMGDGVTIWTALEYASGVEVALDLRNDFIDGETAYRGDAVEGSLDAAAVWKLQKILTPDGGTPSVLYANGSTDFVHIWDDRLSYTYS